METSYLFLGFSLLGLVLTFLEISTHFLPLALAASLSWLSFGFWLLLGDIANLQMSNTWTQVLGFVIILMAFVPIGHFLSRMGKREITINDGDKTYRMWGKVTEKKVSRSSKVKEKRYLELREMEDRVSRVTPKRRKRY